MKKLLSTLLALCMMLSLSAGFAYAAESKVSSVEDLALGISGKYVYFPTELKHNQKKYPVVTWANGSWCPVQTYLAIIKGIAEAGYIVVADTDLLTDDGLSTVDSVDWILEQNKDKDSLFYNRVNTKAIGSTGHSLGGQAAVNAAGMDNRIKAIVSIAGKSTAKEAAKVTVPALYLAGTLDGVVPAKNYVYPSYQASRGPKVYASLKNVEHFACWYTPQDYITYTVGWFDAYLKKDTKKVSMFKAGGQLAKDSHWTDFEYAI